MVTKTSANKSLQCVCVRVCVCVCVEGGGGWGGGVGRQLILSLLVMTLFQKGIKINFDRLIFSKVYSFTLGETALTDWAAVSITGLIFFRHLLDFRHLELDFFLISGF